MPLRQNKRGERKDDEKMWILMDKMTKDHVFMRRDSEKMPKSYDERWRIYDPLCLSMHEKMCLSDKFWPRVAFFRSDTVRCSERSWFWEDLCLVVGKRWTKRDFVERRNWALDVFFSRWTKWRVAPPESCTPEFRWTKLDFVGRRERTLDDYVFRWTKWRLYLVYVLWLISLSILTPPECITPPELKNYK